MNSSFEPVLEEVLNDPTNLCVLGRKVEEEVTVHGRTVGVQAHLEEAITLKRHTSFSLRKNLKAIVKMNNVFLQNEILGYKGNAHPRDAFANRFRKTDLEKPTGKGPKSKLEFIDYQ